MEGSCPIKRLRPRRAKLFEAETTISGDTRADWSEAFTLAPRLEVAYVWYATQ